MRPILLHLLDIRRWKELLYRKHAPPPPTDDSGWFDMHNSAVPWLPPHASHAELVARISQPSRLRFLWLRNPYSRLLSGFLDKGVQPWWIFDLGMNDYGAPFEPSPAEFLRFVTNLVAMRADGVPVNMHFLPQAEQCGLRDGMQYDFFLRVEDIHVWYPDLISLFGLEDTVRSGWGHASNPQLVTTPHPWLSLHTTSRSLMPCMHTGISEVC